MIYFRRTVAIFATIMATLLACASILEILFWNGSVNNTIQNAHQIQKEFHDASTFIDSFIQSNGRLPTDAEFIKWASTRSETAYSARYFHLITSQTKFPIDIIDKFGKPSSNGYIIQYWRGEWFEYYISWINMTTLRLDPSSFYLFGTPTIDCSALIIVSLFMFFLAKSAWPSSHKNSRHG